MLRAIDEFALPVDRCALFNDRVFVLLLFTDRTIIDLRAAFTGTGS